METRYLTINFNIYDINYEADVEVITYTDENYGASEEKSGYERTFIKELEVLSLKNLDDNLYPDLDNIPDDIYQEITRKIREEIG